MDRSGSSPVSRWLPVVSVVFGVFLVFQLGLFAWLILRSLSQREVDRVLLSTQEEASNLAEQLEETARQQDRDLFTALAVARETRTYIDDVLLRRDLVEQVEVTDSDGIIVFQTEVKTRIPAQAGEVPAIGPRELPSRIEQEVDESTTTWEVEEKIGDMGWLRIRFDRPEMERRVGDLRSDLIRRISLIGGVTLVMLVIAYLVIWGLLRRARRLEDQAKEAERMAYLGTLAAGLAHEIRNPLNSLSLNMQMLEEDLEQEAEGSSSRRLLSITKSEIQRLEHLATNFLSYARSRPLERRSMPAVTLLEEAVTTLAGEIDARDARVEIEDEAAGAQVSVDPRQLQQLLLNLLKNALVASEGTGREPRIRLRAGRDGDKVLLEVADNGRGLTEEERLRMFDLFFSTRKGGTGLGLAIVERIARAHGGEMVVESSPGEGTAVRLRLPEAERSSGPGAVPAGLAVASPGHSPA